MIVLKIMSILILVLLVAFLGGLKWNSPGELRRLLVKSEGVANSNGISEKVKLNIGGVEQGIFLYGENIDNPILLFLHGGPGSPVAPLMDSVPNGQRLESSFTVCYWDQRGAGMSYQKDIPVNSMTVSQFLKDGVQISEYLRERFGQDKIYLMGYSWGSYLGLQLAEQHPEFYMAYIGVGQITNQQLSEELAYDYLLAHSKQFGDSKATKKILKFEPRNGKFPDGYLLNVRTKYMNKYGVGMQHTKYSIMNDAKLIYFFRGYTIKEKLNYLRGMDFSMKHLSFDDNFFESIPGLEIPVYLMQGKYDYQVSTKLAQKYYEQVIAPEKDIFIFENSAHSPMVEEPELFLNKMRLIKQKYR